MSCGKFKLCFLELAGIFFWIFSICSWLKPWIQNLRYGRLTLCVCVCVCVCVCIFRSTLWIRCPYIWMIGGDTKIKVTGPLFFLPHNFLRICVLISECSLGRFSSWKPVKHFCFTKNKSSFRNTCLWIYFRAFLL